MTQKPGIFFLVALQEYYQARKDNDLLTAEYIRQHYAKYPELFDAVDTFPLRDPE